MDDHTQTATVWKVVKVTGDGRLVSAIIGEAIGGFRVADTLSIHSPLWSVTYQVGEFVSPNQPDSRLLAFDSIKNAKAFYRKAFTSKEHFMGWYRIYRAEAVDPTPIMFLADLFCRSDIAIDLWKKMFGPQQPRVLSKFRVHAPTGTLACRQIKLIEQVYLTEGGSE